MTDAQKQTYKDIFNQFAEKRVLFSEFNQAWKAETAKFGFADKCRFYGVEYPVTFFQSLTTKTTPEEKRLQKTDLYWRVRSADDMSIFGKTGRRDVIMSRDWYVVTASHGLDLNDIAEGFKKRLCETYLRAWEACEDRSDEIRKGNYRASIHKSL